MQKLIAALTVAVVAITAGCGTPPKRPAFEAQDQVQQFDASDIVGEWDVTILNALEGEQVSSVVYTYEADGRWLSTVKQNASGLDLLAEGVGRWEAREEELFITMDDVQIISDNPLVKMMSGMMKGFIEKSAGSVNPYEITDNRMVWLTEHGQALQLDRR